MTKRRISVVMAAVTAAGLAIGGLTPSTTAQQQQRQSATPADVAMASRFAEMAREALRSQTLTEAHWHASAAMLEAANRLDPGDQRYARHWVEACLQGKDQDGAVNALKAWLRANPSNVTAQTQLVDLYVARMESADQKLAYLKDLIGKPPVGDQVRSHAAGRAARILLDRGESEQAGKTLAEALRLNPLNIDALRLKVQLVAGGTPVERTSAMLALLRANPVQPQVVAAVARQVSDVGLAEAALEWYSLGATLSGRTGIAPTPAFIVGFVSDLYVAGHSDDAEKIATQVVTANPSAVEVWFVKAAIEKGANAATLDETRKKTGTALTNRLAEVRATAGQKGATTRPVDTGPGLEVPDLTQDLKDLKARVDANPLQGAYLSVLADVAWFQTYFMEQPVAPGVLDFLRQTLPADSVMLSRVEGWNALVQGKNDEARVKLSAVADRDPLSKLGVLRLAGKDAARQASVPEEARKLINENPTGVVGAILTGALKDYKGVQLIKTPQAQAVEAELAKFPRDLLKVLDTPQQFYAVRGDPLQISHQFGEPLMVDLTIQNMSDFDLTVGPDGLIRPELWFDARLRGGIDQQVPAVTFDTIADQGVLRARQSISQRVRIDEGQFGQALAQRPTVSVQVYAGVMTNPQSAPNNGLMPGPGGYRVQFPRVMERIATNLGGEAARQRLYNSIANGNGGEKIRTMELLATFVQMIRVNKDATKEHIALADEMYNALRTGMSDGEASVSAYATYLSAATGAPDSLTEAVRQMLTDKSWQRRLLALAIVPSLPPEDRKRLPEALCKDDADATVRAYAIALPELIRVAATQPTSRPADAAAPADPAAGPAANPTPAPASGDAPANKP